MWFKTLESLFDKLQLIGDRVRAAKYRLYGAKIGPKASIAKFANISKARCISTGYRFKVESNVYLKIVSDTAKLRFGNHVFLGKGVEFDVELEVEVGSNVLIAPGTFITDHNHGIKSNSPINSQPCSAKKVTIEDDVWIGANSVILPGVTLFSGAVVGAGSVVNKSVASMTIVAGTPARKIGTRP